VRRCFACLEIAVIAMSRRDKVVAGSKIATDCWLALTLRLLIAHYAQSSCVGSEYDRCITAVQCEHKLSSLPSYWLVKLDHIAAASISRSFNGKTCVTIGPSNHSAQSIYIVNVHS
jgi:hypothetical protein